jgi:hypothetical protein
MPGEAIRSKRARKVHALAVVIILLLLGPLRVR